MDFIGEKCSACGIEFTSEDDVVVCPDCGSPHHRECWKKENRCANEEYHLNGTKWKRAGKPEPAKDIRLCPVCHSANSPEESICKECGTNIDEYIAENSNNVNDGFEGFIGEDKLTFEVAGFDPNEDMGGVTLKEVSDFVGTNTIYYIPIFKRMKDLGTKITFNLACLAFPSLYFANRKMWGWAVFAAVFSILMSLPLVLLYMGGMTELPDTFVTLIDRNKEFLSTLDDIFGFADWIVRLILCFFANKIYFGYVMKSLKKLKSRNMATRENLRTAGGISPSNIVKMVLIKGAMAIAAGFLTYTVCIMMTTLNDFSTAAALFL